MFLASLSRTSWSGGRYIGAFRILRCIESGLRRSCILSPKIHGRPSDRAIGSRQIKGFASFASSLPRLELQGAVIMTKLMAKVCSSIHQIAYFTDFTIVLNWLSAHARRWTTFVAYRVAQIQELSNTQDWFKVDTKLNPADIVSRGLYQLTYTIQSCGGMAPNF